LYQQGFSKIDSHFSPTRSLGEPCISTAGARPNPPWLASLILSGKPIYCGFDADPTGDEMARAMVETHPIVTRLRPPLKDWNEVLKARP